MDLKKQDKEKQEIRKITCFSLSSFSFIGHYINYFLLTIFCKEFDPMMNIKTNLRSLKISKFIAVISLLTITLSFISPSTYCFFWNKSKTNQEIICQLPSTYSSSVSITNSDKTQQVVINKSGSETQVDVSQPASLSGVSLIYTKGAITLKYKDLQCIFKDNPTLDICPLSMIIDIEQIVKDGKYSECEVRDNSLIISGDYSSYSFTFEADLRKNKITCITIPEINLRADYLT